MKEKKGKPELTRTFKLEPKLAKALDYWSKKFRIPPHQFVNHGIALVCNSIDDRAMLDYFENPKASPGLRDRRVITFRLRGAS